MIKEPADIVTYPVTPKVSIIGPGDYITTVDFISGSDTVTVDVADLPKLIDILQQFITPSPIRAAVNSLSDSDIVRLAELAEMSTSGVVRPLEISEHVIVDTIYEAARKDGYA